MRKTFALLSLGAILGLTLLLSGSFWRKDNNAVTALEVQNDLSEYGITVLGASDAEFAQEIALYIGERNSVLPLVQAGAPFAILVKNNSDKEVIGVSLRWRLVRVDGIVEEFPQVQINPGVLMGLKALDPSMVGKTSIINSKARRFFSYFSTSVEQDVNDQRMKIENPTIRYATELDANEIAQAVTAIERQQTAMTDKTARVALFVDGILFNDGTFVGEDRNLAFDSLRGRLQAEADFQLRLRQSRVDGKNARQFLDEFLSEKRVVTQEFPIPERPGPRFADSNQAYSASYEGYYVGLQKRIEMQRSKISDKAIFDQLIRKAEQYIPLRKISR